MKKLTIVLAIFAVLNGMNAVASDNAEQDIGVSGRLNNVEAVADRAHVRINDVEHDIQDINDELSAAQRDLERQQVTTTQSVTQNKAQVIDNKSNIQSNLKGVESNSERISGMNGKVNANTNRTVANHRAINTNTAKINSNSDRIDDLSESLKQQGEEMRERYDGVKATLHAVTNARPVAYDVGEFSMGAGVGAAGSKQALAIGGAYRFNESWSGSFTTSYETAGKQTKEDISAGVGMHFSFK